MARKPAKTAATRRWPEITSEAAVAAVAVLLSIITLTTSAWFALRGSVVTAVTPDSVFFYRDAGSGAVLTAGVDTALVNSASANFGDVVTRITMEIDRPGGSDPAFDYETLIDPVFTEDAERQVQNCPVTARCVRNGQFMAIEAPRRTLDVPGGASRSEYIGFVLHRANCAAARNCDAFTDFDSAVRELDRTPTLVLHFRYQLHSDGLKTATCRIDLGDGSGGTRNWLTARLQRDGWVILPCAQD